MLRFVAFASALRPAGRASYLASLLGVAALALGSRPAPVAPAPAVSWAARADSAQAALTQHFWDAAKQYYREDNVGKTNFNYWWQAHALDALLDGYQRTKNDDYLARMKQLQAGMNAQNHDTYLNEYYDDMEWQALATLRAFELTRDPSYKATAALLWADIQTGWNKRQGGGLAWRKTQLGFKNTPANAPAAILSARLYQLDHQPADLAWAQKIYAWEKKTLVDASSGVVWDGINGKGDGQLAKNLYTYNQGVHLGAGLELYRATRQRAYLDDATRARYVRLLATNGQRLGERAARRPQYLFNTSWTSLPAPTVDTSTQLSGVMLLEALADLQIRKLL